MSKIDLKTIYETLRKWLEVKGEIDKDTPLAEVCDFGESYGFCFAIKDRYANLYWCVDKKTFKPYATRPNLIVEQFKNRKIITLDM